MSVATEKQIEKLALKLQAQGPDMFPFGYYRHLAERELNGDDDER